MVATLDDLRRIASELALDARSDGVAWFEVHVVPANYGGRLGPEEAVLDAVLDGIQDGRARGGTPGGVILGHNRAHPPEEALAAARLAERGARRGVVGLGLVGDEAQHPSEPFAEAFAVARAAGLASLPHAGEAAGPRSVAGAVDVLEAERVLHGVRAVEDPRLVERLADAEIMLDVCPTSNVLLGAAPSLEQHQLPTLLAARVPVSINADCPLFFGVDASSEYLAAHERCTLSAADLARIAADSLRRSRAPRDVAASALPAVEAWARRHVRRSDRPAWWCG